MLLLLLLRVKRFPSWRCSSVLTITLLFLLLGLPPVFPARAHTPTPTLTHSLNTTENNETITQPMDTQYFPADLTVSLDNNLDLTNDSMEMEDVETQPRPDGGEQEEDSDYQSYIEEESDFYESDFYDWPSSDYDDCLYNDTFQDNGNENPEEDSADLKEAYGNILEHVVGGEQKQSDPENLRVRAYVVVRASYGRVLVMGDMLAVWEDEGANDTVGGMMETARDDEDDGVEFEEAERNVTSLENLWESEEGIEDGGDTDDEMTEEAWNNTLTSSSESVTEEDEEKEEEDEKDEEVSMLRTEVTVVQGARVRLVCNVTGAPHYWVEWRREANLTFPDGSMMIGGRSVQLEYVGREDAGTYVCTARNSLGRTHSTALTIHVQYPPVIGVWARDSQASGVELGCLVEGSPRPSSAWYKNNTRLTPASCEGDVEVRSSVLSTNFLLSVVRISNISEENFAYYHCRATNAVGISRAYVMLHDDSGRLALHKLKPKVLIKYDTAVENPRLASFLVGMVPPLYIALYIIAYLGCYKTSLTGAGGHGRFGASMDMDHE